jgi:hypothetical protein
MELRIIYFLLGASDINSAELSEELRDELLARDFTIYYIDENVIEACYKHRYLGALN